MNLHLISSDASGRVCGTNKTQLFDHLPLCQYNDASAILVPVTFFADYRFNETLWANNKPVIVVDYLEYGWSFWHNRTESHIFGDGNLPPYLQQNPEWAKLDQWIAKQPRVLHFKRELLAKDAGPQIRPISFLCMHGEAPLQSREQFESRPCDVINVWGHSHPLRPRLHAKIFEAMIDRGVNVISDWCQLENMPKTPKTWLSVYSPYWCRKPINTVIDFQRQSKISVSMPGAGAHCFRMSESPVDSVMAMLIEPDLAYPFPWIDGKNCVKMLPFSEVESMICALRGEGYDLYECYLGSRENISHYRPDNFVREYFLPEIQKWL